MNTTVHGVNVTATGEWDRARGTMVGERSTSCAQTRPAPFTVDQTPHRGTSSAPSRSEPLERCRGTLVLLGTQFRDAGGCTWLI